MYRFFLLILFLSFTDELWAQNTALTFCVKEDTTCVRKIFSVSKDSINAGNYIIARDYAFEGVNVARRINDKKGLGLCYQLIATSYNSESENDSALYYYNKALIVCQEIGNKKGEANQYNNIGLTYYSEGKHKEAVEFFLKSLKIRENIFDSIGISSVENNLGSVYWYQKAYNDALTHYQRAKEISQRINDIEGQAMTLNNLALIAEEKKDTKSTLMYYEEAIRLHKKISNDWGLSLALNGLGAFYHYTLKKFTEAESLYKESMKINEKIQNTNALGLNLENLGILEADRKNSKSSLEWFNKAIQLYSKNNMPQGLMNLYGRLSEILYNDGKYKEAYTYHVQYSRLRDSLNLGDKLAKMDAKYGKEKREHEIIVLKKEKEVQESEMKRKRIIIYVSILGSIALLVFSGFILREYRAKKKANVLLLTSNIQIAHQKEIIEEKHKEITDSINYAERIQRSFLATTQHLNSNLKEYFIFFKPKDVVSGDFYWSGTLNNSNFVLVTADSTGHGVPGAIMSLLNITSLEKAIEQYTESSDILNHARQTIINRLKNDGSEEGGKDGMDCSLCVFDFRNKTLKIAAAHNPVWIVRANSPFEGGAQRAGDVDISTTFSVIEIKPDKMPVGKHDRQDIPFTQHEIQLQTGDVVYTLTDGFPDQFGGDKGKKFMSKNLREFLAVNAYLPMNEQKELLDKVFADWKGDLEQVDDVTVIGIRIS